MSEGLPNRGCPGGRGVLHWQHQVMAPGSALLPRKTVVGLLKAEPRYFSRPIEGVGAKATQGLSCWILLPANGSVMMSSQSEQDTGRPLPIKAGSRARSRGREMRARQPANVLSKGPGEITVFSW